MKCNVLHLVACNVESCGQCFYAVQLAGLPVVYWPVQRNFKIYLTHSFLTAKQIFPSFFYIFLCYF